MGLKAQTAQQVKPDSAEFAKLFLPNCSLETIKKWDQSGHLIDQRPAVGLAQLVTKGPEALVFVYKMTHVAPDGHSELRLRVVPDPSHQAVLLERKLPGTFLWAQDRRTIGFRLLDLTGDGLDEIVTITAEGASLGGYLAVFALRNEKVESLLAESVDGYNFRFEQTLDKTYQIIVSFQKYPGQKDVPPPSTFHWTGEKFERQN